MKKTNWSKRILRWLLGIAVSVFVLLNIFLAVQAYSCTHLKENTGASADTIVTAGDVVKMLVLGIDIPKPQTKRFPDRKYETIQIEVEKDKKLSAWIMRTDSISKGMVIFFHGFIDQKSMLLDYAYQFMDMGYDAMLIDFMGAGDSYGLQTTIGYKEATNVKATFDYAYNRLNEKNIYLMGFSMGGAAIIKAQHDYNMPVKGLIVEAAYGRMFDTVKIRLKKTGSLSTPLAYMFTFWGGITNDIDAFGMNPEEFVKNIQVPTLIACGTKDQYIPPSETQRIYDNLASEKKMIQFYPECVHEMYLAKYPNEWKKSIRDFLILSN